MGPIYHGNETETCRKTVHKVNRESLINLLKSNQQLHLDISTAPSTTHSSSTLAYKQFSVKVPAQQGKI